ncbi:MAG TPA: acetate--CoA ligase family protein, partial [Rhizomicrobium sp.]|nr:acetate--CoA ligase family protein [Rhizomicrobium sp.]
DAGGVKLGIADAATLKDGIATVLANVRRARPDIVIDRVLVQSMAAGIGEVLVGFRRDADAGPIIMLASGGIMAELSEARSLRLAPVDEVEALEMIGEIPALKALSGYRGKPMGDIEALAKAVAALSRLAGEPDVFEAEINPLIVRKAGDGVVAVDALMRVMEDNVD